ncbi:MAG: cell division protein ZapA [Bacteroidales bacterium]|nr:cell division protein ZapA [Bacteroidales bacterium]
MSDKLTINLAIAGKNHPISFAKEDEELIRKAAKMVGELTSNYQRKYEDSDLEMKDFFSFTAFQFAFEYLKLAEQKGENPLLDTLKVLDADLEQFLKEK